MSNECTLLVETELPISLTVADGAGIEKGSVLQLADPATVSKASGDNQVVGGIAGSEKIASDGMVDIDVYRGGIWRGTASGSIATGDGLGTTTYDNELISNRASSLLSGSKSLGIALEDANDGDTFRFELKPSRISAAL